MVLVAWYWLLGAWSCLCELCYFLRALRLKDFSSYIRENPPSHGY